MTIPVASVPFLNILTFLCKTTMWSQRICKVTGVWKAIKPVTLTGNMSGIEQEWTGFYMIGASVTKELTNIPQHSLLGPFSGLFKQYATLLKLTNRHDYFTATVKTFRERKGIIKCRYNKPARLFWG